MRHAFSLVELSIVLVILGLLTGGILAGQSLIRAAELRAVSTEFQRHTSALLAFRDRYQALPGDMRNAVRFWTAQAGGSADGADATCAALTYTSPATGAATCNGNGDGLVSYHAGTVSLGYEPFRAWHHLANAGLVEGSYTGVTGAAAATYSIPGQNVPRSRAASDLGWSFGNTGNVTSGFVGNYGHTLVLSTGEGHDEGFLIAEEGWNIDTKLDDGRPGTGRVRTMTNAIRPNCASTSDPATAVYQVTNTTKFQSCVMIFMTGL